MFSADGIHLVVLVAAAAAFLVAGWRDMRSFTIPNAIIVTLATLYPIHVFASPAAVAWAPALVLAAVTFAAGCGLFALRAMGGGDVKLLTVAMLWAGSAHAIGFIVVTAATGLVLAAAFAVGTAVVAARASGNGVLGAVAALRFAPVSKLMIPYGVAIAAGGLYVAMRLHTG